jgi:hypothetical protein
MKLKTPIILLSVICSAAQSSELDNLIDSSGAILQQLQTGTMLVGAAIDYGHTGQGMTSGNVSELGHISDSQLQAYNMALTGFQYSYQPYGDAQTTLEQAADEQLGLMSEAVDVFTEVTTELMVAAQVNEAAVQAVDSPKDQEALQTFVAENDLSITQESVDTYNTALDDVEAYGNTAAAYLAVSQSKEATSFFETGAEGNNTRVDQAVLSYDANNQWVMMKWQGTNNATAVYLNGASYSGLDVYVDDTTVLQAGLESDYYHHSLAAQGYDCYMNQSGCDHEY